MKLMILDGNSIINRAFYGIRPLTAPDGTPTNAVYGFLAILRRVLDLEAPDGLCVAFDLPAPTFRHEMYPLYKAQRKGMPEELAVQLPIMKRVLDAMNIPRLEASGWEADDILGTVARLCSENGWTTEIVTGDRDSFQLIDKDTSVLHIKTRAGQTETTLYDEAKFREEYGFPPAGIVDLKALMGDASDNIPGVAGIGEKTATELVRSYGSVGEIYSRLPELDIKPAVRKKLEAGADSAKLSYTLATISRSAPVTLDFEAARWTGEFSPELYDIFESLGFNRLIERWGLEKSASPAATSGPEDMPVLANPEPGEMIAAIKEAPYISVAVGESLDTLSLCDGKNVYSLDRAALFDAYDGILREIFSPEVRKVSANVKDLMTLLSAENLPRGGFIFDTALAAWVLDPTEGVYDAERLSQRYLGGKKPEAEALWRLWPIMDAELSKNGEAELYYKIELPLCEVLSDMETAGFLVDRNALFEFGESLTGSIASLQERVWAYAGHEFNLNSPRQLGTVLFEELHIPGGKKTKTGWSTNADVLERLAGDYPIVADVLEYRTLAKLKSTYADGLLKVISPDGRIHTNFKMTATATGRISSTEPNLQNIPVRRSLGAQIRRMFVAPAGSVLVDADYSQIELRILAHMSGDGTMRQAFLSGGDIHTVTASQVFGVPPESVTPEQRRAAKAVNFGIVYGISAFSLSQDIGVRPYEAQAYIDAYMERYHGVREYLSRSIESAKSLGYAETLFHRKRPMPELKSDNRNMRAFGERVARNMPIQGTAADVIKLAMVNVQRRFKAEGLRARLILQVHDELIAECPASEAERVKELLREEMEGAVALTVPLTADAGTGASWAEAH